MCTRANRCWRPTAGRKCSSVCLPLRPGLTSASPRDRSPGTRGQVLAWLRRRDPEETLSHAALYEFLSQRIPYDDELSEAIFDAIRALPVRVPRSGPDARVGSYGRRAFEAREAYAAARLGLPGPDLPAPRHTAIWAERAARVEHDPKRGGSRRRRSVAAWYQAGYGRRLPSLTVRL
jgi:hypothetical protein